MSAKHTPGPWNAEPMIRDHGFPYTPVMATTLIARVYSTAFGDDEQSLANAALIAAAPELLAEAIADDGLAVFIERTLAAVALPSGHPEVSRAFGDIRGALASRGALRRAVIAKAEGRA